MLFRSDVAEVWFLLVLVIILIINRLFIFEREIEWGRIHNNITYLLGTRDLYHPGLKFTSLGNIRGLEGQAPSFQVDDVILEAGEAVPLVLRHWTILKER